jgi:hypothetical protein
MVHFQIRPSIRPSRYILYGPPVSHPRPWIRCRQLRQASQSLASTPTTLLTEKQLFYPSNVTYPSGQTIHLRLSIESTGAPALALLLIQGLEAQFVKYMVARTQSGRVVVGREVVLSRGNVTEIDTTEEGFAISYFDLTLGEPGKEQSWAIDDDIKMTVSCLPYVFSNWLTCTNRTVSDPSLCELSG